MFQALADPGEGLHVSGVRTLLPTLLLAPMALLTAVPTAAQVRSIDELLEAPRAQTPEDPGEDFAEESGDDRIRIRIQDTENSDLDAMTSEERAALDSMLGGGSGEVSEDGFESLLEGDNTVAIAPDLPPPPPAPDYSDLPPRAEREARLEVLHERLAAEDDAKTAALVSEEIWAIWMDSGSASVNYLLVRADEAAKRGDGVEAARMVDLMLDLEPDFAEGWSRSARLALVDEDYSRAAAHATEALVRNPRHYYALWTLGNVLERLGRAEAALEVYEEAHALYPALENVAERRAALRSDVLGDVL